MKDKYFKWLLIISGILLLLVIAYPLLIKYIFKTWQDTGTFGDSYGALNTLFSGLAFAGLIITILIQKKELKNQRKELKLQRKEMIETRKEFLLNRITNLVYNQLERFEKSIDRCIINHNGFTYTGREAIAHLDHISEIFVYDHSKSPEENLENQKMSIVRQSKIHTANKKEIYKFSQDIYNSLEALKAMIFKSTLDVEELNNLKNLFFDNIGFINMGVIENISEITEKEFEIFEISDYQRLNINVGEMQRANIFLKPVKEFYKIKLTKENFEDLKAKWQSSKGSNH